jgi:hypothetical protein
VIRESSLFSLDHWVEKNSLNSDNLKLKGKKKQDENKLRPCLVHSKMQKVFKISRHIAYVGTYIEH